MELLRFFAKISKHDAAIAGGKGASLGEMTQAGIPVPPGYVILADAFEQFISETKLKAEIDSILHRVKKEEMESVERASEEIQALILSAKMPKDIEKEIKKYFKELNAEFVAVRSSATAEDSSAAAWAGQLDTFLNTTEKTLLQNVQKCWASLFTPRAIFYRFEKGLHKTHISVAVVVQKMVQSEISGIAFSVHPVTQDYNQMIIEGGLGLGEAIVSGQITPDSYVLEKKPFSIIQKNISAQTKGIFRQKQGGNAWKDIPAPEGEKQKLSEKQILELGKLILRIEEHYDFPVDVEWAYENGKFYITQSRPITTLQSKSHPPQKKVFTAPRVFSRDFSVAAIQIATRCESMPQKPWTTGERGYSPHIIGERTDGTIHWYYHPHAWEWLKKQLIARCKEDDRFISKVEQHVRKGIAFIRPIYEGEKILSLKQLKSFMHDFIQAYPWIEAMWLLYRMESPELGVDNTAMKKLRAQTDRLSAGTDVVIRKSLQKAYPELGKWVAFMTLDEIMEGKIPSMVVLQERDRGFILVDDHLHVGMTHEQLRQQYGIEFEKIIAEKDQKTIQGESAQKGKARGIVCRVMGHHDFGKIKQGEILISPMTMPDFLPEMKKAAAIITDEGGMMCHAAIVAREMKKPCIVGTKIATAVLKDGDEVELDAGKGIVKILSSKTGKHFSTGLSRFEKTYTRDTGLMIQQGWFHTFAYGMEKRFGWKSYPFPPTIYYVHDGTVEIWENLQATQWFMNRLLEENERNPTFLHENITGYESLLKKMSPYWQKGALNSETELKQFIELMFDALIGFGLWYYSALNEKTPPKIRELAVKVRDRDVFFDRTDKLLRASLRKIYPSLAGYETTLLVEEIGKIPPINQLKKRKKHFVMVPGIFMEPITLQAFAKKHPQFQFAFDNIHAYFSGNKLKGQTSYPGLATGVVRVLRRKEQVGEVKQGEIIVSPMTTPDFLPAMKRAAAVVTDEGGITCHAAIVTRELKIPCVIGTKVATHVFKDGDLVEVDATKGIVRKLKP